MKKTLTVGMVTTLSGRWPRELPEQRMKEYGEWVRNHLPDARVVPYGEIADTAQRIDEAVSLFKREGADIVIMLYGAFTGDDLPCALADGLKVPIILWAPYEPPFERETRLFANALVAATMNSAALHRIGRECHVIYGSKEDGRIARQLQRLIAAYGVVKNLNHTFFGLFGYRPTAFYNCAFDEGLIRRTFGIRMEETDLKVVFDRMAQLSDETVKNDMESVSGAYDTTRLPAGHLENHSRLYVAMKQLMAEQGYNFAAIKCWPEMGNLHTTPCAVLGRLADEGLSVICEGDVDAGLATIVQRYLTEEPTFVSDMINIDETANTMTFWHCGQAAPSLMNTADGVSINNHPLAGQGTAFYGALKSGKVTVARFCNIGGVYKLFLLRGEAVPTVRNTRGVMVNVKVEKPVREIIQRVFDEGIAHHYSLVWEDVADEMAEVARLLGIEVIEA